jgi:hypothetical protein
MELGKKEEKQEKVVSVSYKENKRTFKASIEMTSPSRARY